jgi:hypothetical protein
MQSKNRILAFILMLCTTLSLFSFPAFAQGHWSDQAVNRWSNEEILKMEGDGLFDPDAPMTRGELAVILDRLLQLKNEAPNTFPDLPANKPYTRSVLKCVAAGFIQGNGVNIRPEDPITREETLTILGRALGIEPEETCDKAFQDEDNISPWARGYVNALVNAGYIKGVSDNLLAPDRSLTGGAIATVLDRAVTTYITEPGRYTLTRGEIVIVRAAGVVLEGNAAAVILSPGIDGGTVTLNNFNADSVLIQASNTEVNISNSQIGNLSLTGTQNVLDLDKTSVSAVNPKSGAEAQMRIGGDVKLGNQDDLANNPNIGLASVNPNDSNYQYTMTGIDIAINNTAADAEGNTNQTLGNTVKLNGTSVTGYLREVQPLWQDGGNYYLILEVTGLRNGDKVKAEIGETTESEVTLSNNEPLVLAVPAENSEDVKITVNRIGYLPYSVTLELSGIVKLEADTEAVIGTQQYSSLEAALDAAQSGQTIDLVQDITSDSMVSINKDITLRGNDYEIAAEQGFIGEVLLEITADVILDGVNLAEGITADGGAELTIKGGSRITGNANCDILVKDATLKVQDGVVGKVVLDEGADYAASFTQTGGSVSTIAVESAAMLSAVLGQSLSTGTTILLTENATLTSAPVVPNGVEIIVAAGKKLAIFNASENTSYTPKVSGAGSYGGNGYPAQSGYNSPWSGCGDYGNGPVYEINESADLLQKVKDSNGEATIPILSNQYTAFLANPTDVYIYNGKPGDSDFGTKVAANLKDEYNACLSVFSPYIWMGGLDAPAKPLPMGYYTIVLYYEEDGVSKSVSFTDWVRSGFKTTEAVMGLTMVPNTAFTYLGFPDSGSGINNAWPGTEDGDYGKGLAYQVLSGPVYSAFQNTVKAANESVTLKNGVPVDLADTDNVMIYNGAPGDADFGSVVAANLYEEYGAYLSTADLGASGQYIWIGNIWNDIVTANTLEDGIYTVILFAANGDSYYYTDYIRQDGLDFQCEMVPNDYYTNYGKPVTSSLVDAWSGTADDAPDVYTRGLTYHMTGEHLTALQTRIAGENSDATLSIMNGGITVYVARTDRVFIYNGRPGDANYGTTVSGNLYEDYGACLASTDMGGANQYIWLGGIWERSANRTLNDGWYTFVYVDGNNNSIYITEYIIQNFYEGTYDY